MQRKPCSQLRNSLKMNVTRPVRNDLRSVPSIIERAIPAGGQFVATVREFGALLACLAFSFAAPAFAQAADDPAEPGPIKHRVTGLFSPDRQDDLRAAVERLPNVKLVSIDYKLGEATFAYDPEKFLNGAKPEQVVERFDNLLRSVSFATFGIMPLCTTPRDKLQFVEIGVVGLDCKGCCLAAYESIYRLEGVEQATASFKDGLVTALINPEKTDRSALEKALKSRNVQLAVP